jgi:hypothetical protein
MPFIKNFNQTFFQAPIADKKLVLYVFIWSAIVRFNMLFVPFKYYRKLLGNIQVEAQNNLEIYHSEDIIHIRDLVLAVCRHTPWDSKCLVQAVICKRLLKKRGFNSTLYLGVKTAFEKKKMEAHAWLKLDDLILTGAKRHRHFKVVSFFG